MSDDYVFADELLDEPTYWVTPLVMVDEDGSPRFEAGLGREATSLEKAKDLADQAHADAKDGHMYFVFEMATTVGPMETLLGALTGSEVVVSYREVYRTEGGPICHTLTAVF